MAKTENMLAGQDCKVEKL